MSAPRRATSLGLPGLALVGALMAVWPSEGRASEQTLLLAVDVNGYATHKIGEFVWRDGALLARPEELVDLGFKLAAPLRSKPDGLIALSDLPELTWRLDQASQTVSIKAADDRLAPALLDLRERVRTPGAIESGTGATLNYDVTATSVGHGVAGAGSYDFRAFSPWGVFSTNWLAYTKSDSEGAGARTIVRLDTAYRLSDPDTLRQYVVGDFITGGLSATRPVRLGGVQIGSNFAIRPDLVTFPLPEVSGSAAVPSTVDVLINGARLLSRTVDPGPFEIQQLPVMTGAGTISMTVTDALGRQVVVNLPFYGSADLLAPGLQSYSAQLGVVRRNWGVVSDDYGDPAGVVAYRRGVSSAVTVEGSAEGTAGAVMASGGVVVNLGNLAILDLSAAGSAGSGRAGSLRVGTGGNGTQFSAGLQRIGTVFSFAASATAASARYRDIAAMNGDPPPRRQLNASVSLSLGRFGTVAVSYAGVDRAGVPSVPAVSFNTTQRSGSSVLYLQPAQRAQVISASWSVPMGGMSLFATGFRDLASAHDTGMVIGLAIPLGSRSSGSVTAGAGSGGRTAQAQIQQSAISAGDWGYQAAVGQDQEFARLQYKSPWNLLTAGVDRTGRQTTLRAEAEGAVSLADGGVFPSNTVHDAFAVVDTDGQPHIHVLQENREAGFTNSAGKLLVPDLRSFDVNRIAIEPTDVPQDATIDASAREVRPQDRSGVVVKFPIRASRGALLTLVDETGAALPLGSVATLRASGAAFPVGYDGAAYLTDLGAHNELVVERPDGRRCGLAFDYRPLPGEIPKIRPPPCRALP